MKAAICPVCNGSGKYQTPKEAMDGDIGVKCHGCQGLGWIEVHETIGIPVPYPVPSWPVTPQPLSPWYWPLQPPTVTW